MELKKLGAQEKKLKKKFIQAIVDDWIKNDNARVYLVKRTCADHFGAPTKNIGDIRVWEGANVSFVHNDAHADLYEIDTEGGERLLFITNVYFGKNNRAIG